LYENLVEDRRRDGTIGAGESHRCAQLTAAQVIEARQLIRSGAAGIKELAARYGVTTPTLREAVTGSNWPHIVSEPPATIGRARGIRHGNAKFTNDQIDLIRAEVAVDYSAIDRLARQFNVSARAIEYIVARKTWRHIP
jgi:hypothetical protein